MLSLLLATSNPGKVREMKNMLGALPVIVQSLAEAGLNPAPPEETGSTYAENALIKARFYGGLYPGWVLAEDSGLEVPALGLEPGMFSARYAGPGAGDAANRRLLLERIREKGLSSPPARFVCCACLFRNSYEPRFFEAAWEGRIAPQERGAGGFGYDPIFVPLGGELSAAELPAVEKNRVSHRGAALRMAAGHLAGLLALEKK